MAGIEDLIHLIKRKKLPRLDMNWNLRGTYYRKMKILQIYVKVVHIANNLWKFKRHSNKIEDDQ
jgi:hypothetical protein